MLLFESFTGLIFACLLFVASCGCGLLVVPDSIARPSLRALAGIPLFFIIGTSWGLLLYIVSSTEIAVGAVVILALTCAAFAAFRGVYKDLFKTREILLLAALLFVGYAVMVFGWGEAGDGTVRALPGSWGDGPLHTLNAQAFAKGTKNPLAMPAFAGFSHREPFGYDAAAGFLLKGGFGIGSAFTLPAAGLLAALLGWTGFLSLQTFQRRVKGNMRVSEARIAFFITTFLLLFGGGLQWAVMATLDKAWSPGAFFGIHDRMWNIQEELGLIWANHINIFVSQKHLVLGLSFLVVLAVVSRVIVENQQLIGRYRILLIFLAVVTGLLPLFHAHVFLGAAVLWITMFIISKYSRFVFLSGLVAAIIASPFFLWYTGAVTREGFTTFALGYLAPHSQMPWSIFWIVNLGVFPFIVIFALTRQAYGKSRILLGVPATVLFLLGNTFQFQPHLWDNIKVFQIAWILLLPFVVSEIVVLVRSVPHRIGYAVLGIVILLTMSLTTLSEFATYLNYRKTYPVYTTYDRETGRVLDVLLPNNAVVLAASNDIHNHPITLTGRTLASGYTGWIWSRGLPWDQRLNEMNMMIHAPSMEQLCTVANHLSLTHIVVTNIERFQWSDTTSPFMNDFLRLDEAGIRAVSLREMCIMAD